MKHGSTIHSSRAWGLALAVASLALALSPTAPRADNGDFHRCVHQASYPWTRGVIRPLYSDQ